MGTRRRQGKDLAQRCDEAAKDLQDLAQDITRVIDVLPRRGRAPLTALLEQQARRALAISAALRVEASDPDPEVGKLLLQARTAIAVALVFLVTSVGVGALEQAGSEAWDAVRNRAERILDEPSHDGAPSVVLPNAFGPDGEPKTFGEALRAMRLDRGLTVTQLAKLAKVGRGSIQGWESGDVFPRPQTVAPVLAALGLARDEQKLFLRVIPNS